MIATKHFKTDFNFAATCIVLFDLLPQ